MAQNVFTGIRRVLLTPLVLQAATVAAESWLQAGSAPCSTVRAVHPAYLHTAIIQV